MFFDIKKVVVDDYGKHPYLYVKYREELIGSVPLNVISNEMALLITTYDSFYYHEEDEYPIHKVVYLNFFLDNEQSIDYWHKAMSGEAY